MIRGTRVGLSVLDLRTALETGSCEPSPVSDSLQDRSRWSQADMRCVLCLVAARWTDVAPGSCALAVRTCRLPSEGLSAVLATVGRDRSERCCKQNRFSVGIRHGTVTA